MHALPVTSLTEAIRIHAAHKAHANDPNARLRHGDTGGPPDTFGTESSGAEGKTRNSHDGILDEPFKRLVSLT